jgi:hypothetical protein
MSMKGKTLLKGHTLLHEGALSTGRRGREALCAHVVGRCSARVITTARKSTASTKNPFVST